LYARRFGLAVVAFVWTGTISGGGCGGFAMRRYVALEEWVRRELPR